jgi:hypothetical protein
MRRHQRRNRSIEGFTPAEPSRDIGKVPSIRPRQTIPGVEGYFELPDQRPGQ